MGLTLVDLWVCLRTRESAGALSSGRVFSSMLSVGGREKGAGELRALVGVSASLVSIAVSSPMSCHNLPYSYST